MLKNSLDFTARTFVYFVIFILLLKSTGASYICIVCNLENTLVWFISWAYFAIYIHLHTKTN